jgi:hypothetical protein
VKQRLAFAILATVTGATALVMALGPLVAGFTTGEWGIAAAVYSAYLFAGVIIWAYSNL